MSKIDRYHGVGGSYVVDPKTKERARVDGPPLEGEQATSKPAAARAARASTSTSGARGAAQPAAQPDATSSDAGGAAQAKKE